MAYGRRFGRGFPTPSPLVAAALQVPIAGTGAMVLPHPLVMVAHGSVGIIANGAMVLPHPLVMVGSGAVGSGSIAGSGAFTLPHPLVLVGSGTVGTVITIPTNLWSSADLLQRCKFYAQRPAIDASMADSDWFSLMTEAQVHWTRVIATMTPEALYGPPFQMVTNDGGFTYTFGVDADGNQINPIGYVEIKLTPTGRPFFAGADFDQSGDFIWEGDRIRFYGQRARPFANGPWARFVAPSGTMNGTIQPSIKPQSARILIVHRAVYLWASRGGFRNPAPFLALEKAAWLGDPNSGDTGILGSLKTTYYTRGSEAIYGAGASGNWWNGISTGLGYSPIAP